MTLTVVDGAATLAETAAGLIAGAIQAASAARGSCLLALAGGGTPRACYERLAAEPYRSRVRWEALQVYWSDERLVPLDDPESNYAMARQALLSRVPIPSGAVNPAPVAHPDPALAARRYEEALRRLSPVIPRFDLILLGLGEDGHTASLFPGDAALEEERALVRAVRAVKPPPNRITFTFPLINAARQVLFLVQGEGKRAALKGVLEGDRRLPAARVEPLRGELRFLVDRAAAGQPDKPV